jgi:drug/metabolite transporter (DMT)-like permease
VSCLQHLVSLVTIAATALLLDSGSPGRVDYLWGVAAGVALGVAKPLLYAGLSFGTISVFAPIVAVVSIVVPVGASLAAGEQPGAWALIGVGLSLPAVVLVSRGHTPAPGSWSPGLVVGTALVSGTLLGLNALSIGQMADHAGLMPVVLGYVLAGILITGATLAAGEPLLPTRPARAATLAAGGLDGTGFACTTLALQQGLVSVAAALFALAPVVPVALAWAFLRERLAPVQTAAVVLAFLAVVLMTLGCAAPTKCAVMW